MFDKQRRFVRRFRFEGLAANEEHSHMQFALDAFGNLLAWHVNKPRVCVYTPHGEKLATLFQREHSDSEREFCTATTSDDGRVFVVSHTPDATVYVLAFVV